MYYLKGSKVDNIGLAYKRDREPLQSATHTVVVIDTG